MIIEIRKAGFINKGAELMLHAVVRQIRARYPEATLTMAPTHAKGSRPFHKLAVLGFHPKISLLRLGIQWGVLGRFIPRILREMYGLVLDREVDVVLDAAGFSYSDQCGTGNARELAHSAKRWRKNGTRVVLLPQAFGPFESKSSRQDVNTFVDNIDLICAREATSLRLLTEITGHQERVRQYPDFTNLLPGVVPEDFDRNNNRVALVPNHRMVEKPHPREREAYVPFMVRCASQLISKGAKPFILVHSGEQDLALARQISEGAGGIPVVAENDALKIKGVLGACDATIGSRFHGLVSALSQGVPSLATGWSHKYQELLHEYGFPEGVVSVLASDEEIEKHIARLTDESLRKTIQDRSEQLKQLSERMWEDVFDIIDR